MRLSSSTKTATFLSAIGEEALEIYKGMTFYPPESSKVLDSDVQKFEEYCIVGEAGVVSDKPMRRSSGILFNSRQQKEDE